MRRACGTGLPQITLVMNRIKLSPSGAHMHSSRILFLAAVVALALCSCSPQPSGHRYSFANALTDNSTEYPIVRIKLFDQTTREYVPECVAAVGLLSAVSTEFGLKDSSSGWEEARRVALKTPHQRFKFTKPQSIVELRPPWFKPAQARAACTAIESGYSAKIGVNTAMLYVGDNQGNWVASQMDGIRH